MVPMNDNQYIIIGSKFGNSTYAIYDTIKDEFSEPIKYEMASFWNPFGIDDYITCEYNQDNQLLYVYTAYGNRLAVVDTKTNKMNIISQI